MLRKHGICCLLLGLLFHGPIHGEEVRFDTPAEWATWEVPEDIVQFADDGSLELTKFRKEINATLDAHLFTQPTQTRGKVQGGVWQAGSNPTAARRIMDGDLETVWRA